MDGLGRGGVSKMMGDDRYTPHCSLYRHQYLDQLIHRPGLARHDGDPLPRLAAVIPPVLC